MYVYNFIICEFIIIHLLFPENQKYIVVHLTDHPNKLVYHKHFSASLIYTGKL